MLDINNFYNMTSGAVKEAASHTQAAMRASYNKESQDAFSNILNSAISNLETTNSYISDMENEEIKLALGDTDNTHDLAIAIQKASTSLQYTVAIRDKFLDAYKEIMQMQI